MHLVGRKINLVGRKIPLVGLVTDKCILLGREIHFGWIHWKYERGWYICCSRCNSYWTRSSISASNVAMNRPLKEKNPIAANIIHQHLFSHKGTLACAFVILKHLLKWNNKVFWAESTLKHSLSYGVKGIAATTCTTLICFNLKYLKVKIGWLWENFWVVANVAASWMERNAKIMERHKVFFAKISRYIISLVEIFAKMCRYIISLVEIFQNLQIHYFSCGNFRPERWSSWLKILQQTLREVGLTNVIVTEKREDCKDNGTPRIGFLSGLDPG